jgi:hypothetical protein
MNRYPQNPLDRNLLRESYSFGGWLTLINYLDSILSVCVFLCFDKWKKREMSSAPPGIVKLVDRMLDLHKKPSASKVPDEKTKLQRQISTTDKQIDRLVYELYNLTDEEIKIIEESTK